MTRVKSFMFGRVLWYRGCDLCRSKAYSGYNNVAIGTTVCGNRL